MDLKNSTKLGQATEYPDQYDPAQLTPIARSHNREKLGIDQTLPFVGEDLWNAYELSWLNARGKPQVAVGVFRISCDSRNIVESKSFKLYLNSFNQTRFSSPDEVSQTMQKDLEKAVNGDVQVEVVSVTDWQDEPSSWLQATCLDDLDIECSIYTPDSKLITLEKSQEVVTETLSSHLLKSNCPVTGQPDWATVYIRYTGPKIERAGLLRYIVSMRGHQDFHEHCVESIFSAVMAECEPEKLAVYARYTRRGGLDINPIRANYPVRADNFKLARQ